ncbi:hypothetical protein [uncultured Devosia sp.]|uniref:hypothetical protein n=1 Tax=uncultured Devosia sp. TaxID=211434 RepID=UPI0035CC0316
MRLLVRIAGTWLVGLALVLAVIDGTKSLGASRLAPTSLAQSWKSLNPSSLVAVESFFDSRYFANLLDGAMAGLLSYPTFAVAGVTGIVLILLGRAPRRERYLHQDQI